MISWVQACIPPCLRASVVMGSASLPPYLCVSVVMSKVIGTATVDRQDHE
jgi:hypothetical protein